MADRQVDVMPAAFAVLRPGAGLPLRPLAAECRIAHVQLPCRDLAAKYSHYHPPDPDSRPVCAQVAGPVLAGVAKGTEAAVLVCLCRVQMAQAIHLWAVPQACLSDRAAVVHLV